MTYIVMTSSAKPKGGWGRYTNVAVVELTQEYAEQGLRPRQISERDKGVKRIIKHYGGCHVGKTSACEYQRALADAHTLADKLNGEVEWWP